MDTAPTKAALEAEVKRLERLERELAKAQAKSHKAMDARRKHPPGTSRARSTTLNANWARAAEQRDRVQAALDAARAALARAT